MTSKHLLVLVEPILPLSLIRCKWLCKISMINIFPIDKETLPRSVSCYKMLWIFIVIIFRSRSNDETFISCLPSTSQSIYLHWKDLWEKKINHVAFQAWFLMSLELFYCRQFSLSSLINKSFPLRCLVYLKEYLLRSNRFIVMKH